MRCVSVNLAEVYIDLTILKDKPREINFEDETTYIAHLRKIANKEVEIAPVDFTVELMTYEPTKRETWCLIGNPGCGKTFLAKRTALRFGSYESSSHVATQIGTLWSPHALKRKKSEICVHSKMAMLGMPVGFSWTFSEALNESSGEGLLLIIDALDEFTRKVPFAKTFLCLLLTHQFLTNSTIVLTTRPGAWTDISSNHELKIDRYYQVLGFSPKKQRPLFIKQITNEAKLKECCSLMERHNEMKQLSLIPVNASLFASVERRGFQVNQYTNNLVLRINLLHYQ